MAEWPGGARGALCLSFDNLGEAAAIELGALAADDPSIGAHPTVTQTLPSLLELLGERGLAATFFVEGLNAAIYPAALKEIAACGHEVGYHAWRHETWGELTTAEQAENLARGLDAWAALGLEAAGFRPPGGQLGKGGVEVLREAGLRYASPAGAGAGCEDGVALLPFQWRHVDATCLLPPLAPVREQMSRSPDPLDPDTFVAYLNKEIEGTEQEEGFMSIVLHLPLLAWLGEENLATILNKLSSSRSWVARCDKIADYVRANPTLFENSAALDQTSWA